MNVKYSEMLQKRLKGEVEMYNKAEEIALKKGEQLKNSIDKVAAIVIDVATEFSPDIRWRDGYEYSGKPFRSSLLLKQYELAKSTNKLLIVNFNGTKGVPISFHQEAFAETIAANLVNSTSDFFDRVFIKYDAHDKVVEVYEEMIKVM